MYYQTGVPGMGRSRCFWPRHGRFYYPEYFPPYPGDFDDPYYGRVAQLDDESEISLLEERERWLREYLEEVSKRIGELKKSPVKKSTKRGD